MSYLERTKRYWANVRDTDFGKATINYFYFCVSIYAAATIINELFTLPLWLVRTILLVSSGLYFLYILLDFIEHFILKNAGRVTRFVTDVTSRYSKILTITSIFILLSGVLLAWSRAKELKDTTVLDNRDGQRYQIVTLDSLVWTRENLRYSDDSDGIWLSESSALYNWEQAKKACAGLGEGWRLPTTEELESFKEHINFKDPDFHNVLGGEVSPDGKFYLQGTNGILWSGDESRDGYVWILYIYGEEKKLEVLYHGGKDHGYSCRCVKGTQKQFDGTKPK